MTAVYRLNDLPLSESEILAYAGFPKRKTVDQTGKTALSESLAHCLSQLPKERTGVVCYGTVPLRISADTVNLSFTEVCSKDLARHLKNCSAALVFAATVGLSYDRLIRRSASLSPLNALLFEAIGTQQIEALCDAFCLAQKEQLHGQGLTITSRFSPGYGDLPLSLQKELLPFLDSYRSIGLTLSDSLLMIPQKSVTAIAGIRPLPAKNAESLL